MNLPTIQGVQNQDLVRKQKHIQHHLMLMFVVNVWNLWNINQAKLRGAEVITLVTRPKEVNKVTNQGQVGVLLGEIEVFKDHKVHHMEEDTMTTIDLKVTEVKEVEDTGIVLGAHACAMTVATGKIVVPPGMPAFDPSRLGSLQCPN